MSDQFPKKVAKEAILAFVKGFFSRLGDIFAHFVYYACLAKLLTFVTSIYKISATINTNLFKCCKA